MPDGIFEEACAQLTWRYSITTMLRALFRLALIEPQSCTSYKTNIWNLELSMPSATIQSVDTKILPLPRAEILVRLDCRRIVLQLERLGA